MLLFRNAVALFTVLIMSMGCKPHSSYSLKYVVTLSPRTASLDGVEGKADRFFIASIEEIGKSPEILSRAFWTAYSPSVSFDGKKMLFAGKLRKNDAVHIWEMTIHNRKWRSITVANGNPDYPVYLPDGRILFSDLTIQSQTDRHNARSLFTVSPDGEDIHQLTFDYQINSRPKILRDGRVLFERTVVSENKSYKIDMTIHPDGTLISKYVGSKNEQKTPSPDSLELGNYIALDVVSAAEKAIPPVLPSVVDQKKQTGTLLCLNIYESLLPNIAGLRKGTIDKVRVRRAEPPGRTDSEPVQILGEASIMEDGSFYITVPADTDLALDLILKNGRTMASLDSGIWVRPNENRGCIGCHENPYLSPENKQPLAVKSATPVALLGGVRLNANIR